MLRGSEGTTVFMDEGLDVATGIREPMRVFVAGVPWPAFVVRCGPTLVRLRRRSDDGRVAKSEVVRNDLVGFRRRNRPLRYVPLQEWCGCDLRDGCDGRDTDTA